MHLRNVLRQTTFIFLCVLAPAGVTATPVAAQELRIEVEGQSEAQAAAAARLSTALDQPITADFYQDPLENVLENLALLANVDIEIDAVALDRAGLPTDIPVSGEFRGQSLCAALHLLLAQHDLEFTLHQGQVLVSTRHALQTKLETRVYPCAPLLANRRARMWLMDTVSILVDPNSWDEVGGMGTIEFNRDRTGLIITQTWANQLQIEDLLRQLLLLHAQAPQNAAAQLQVTLIGQTAPEQAAEIVLRRALAQDANLSFWEDPLSDVAAYLATQYDIQVEIDAVALDDAGTNSELSFTAELCDITLASALNLLLDRHDLAWDIRHESLLISTPEQLEDNLQIRLYHCPALREALARDPDSVIDLITSTVPPYQGDDVGGIGSICVLEEPRVLLVAQTRAVHEQVESLLAQLLAPPPAPGELFVGRVAASDRIHQREDALLAELAQPTDYSFLETPLADAAAYFAALHGMPVEFDRRALERSNQSPDLALTASGRFATLAEGLTALLEPHQLTWTVRDEVLLITTQRSDAWCNQIIVYRGGPLTGASSRGYDPVIEGITAEIAPIDWDEVGGPGSICGMDFTFPDTLVISQSPATQWEIEAWLHENAAAVIEDTAPRSRRGGAVF